MQNYTKYQNVSLFLMRVIIAAIFLVAAYQKLPFWQEGLMEAPTGLVYLMKFLSVVEPLGAIAVLFGFLTRWAAAGLAIIMAGAIGVTQFMMKVGFTTATGAGWNFPLMILAGCIMLTAYGAGKYSLEAVRNK